MQRGGFASEEDARAALERALEKRRREQGVARRLTLAEFVDEYLTEREASPVTLEKLRFLLTRAVAVFGDYLLDELSPVEIAAGRMTIPPGYRFEATQASRPRRADANEAISLVSRSTFWRTGVVRPTSGWSLPKDLSG